MGAFFEHIATSQVNGKFQAVSSDGRVILLSGYDYGSVDPYDGLSFNTIIYSKFSNKNKLVQNEFKIEFARYAASNIPLSFKDNQLTFYVLSLNQTLVAKVTANLKQETQSVEYLIYPDPVTEIYLHPSTDELITFDSTNMKIDNSTSLDIFQSTYTVSKIKLHIDDDGFFIFFTAEASNNVTGIYCQQYDSSYNSVKNQTLNPRYPGTHQLQAFSFNEKEDIFSLGFNEGSGDFSFLVHKLFYWKLYHNYFIKELSKYGTLALTYGNQNGQNEHVFYNFTEIQIKTDNSTIIDTKYDKAGFINSDQYSYPFYYSSSGTSLFYRKGQAYNQQLSEELQIGLSQSYSHDTDHLYLYDNYDIELFKFHENGFVNTGGIIALSVCFSLLALIIMIVLFCIFYDKCKRDLEQRGEERVREKRSQLRNLQNELRQEEQMQERRGLDEKEHARINQKQFAMAQKAFKQICTLCSNSNCNAYLPCQHLFHQRCLQDWINKKGFCPACRKQADFSQIRNIRKK